MSESSESNRDAYARGMIAGEIAGEISARLAGHDRHFAAINGHLGDLAGEFRELRLIVQQLRDQAVARDEATKTSLQIMDQKREVARDDRWLPWVKVYALISTLTLIFMVVLILGGLV